MFVNTAGPCFTLGSADMHTFIINANSSICEFSWDLKGPKKWRISTLNRNLIIE